MKLDRFGCIRFFISPLGLDIIAWVKENMAIHIEGVEGLILSLMAG